MTASAVSEQEAAAAIAVRAYEEGLTKKERKSPAIREVMEMIKTALELALLPLRILREILGLFQDRKHPRRPDKR